MAWARERGAVVASDECYGEFGWEAEPVSVLHPESAAATTTVCWRVHSLSKRSNLAGYRAGFVAGDAALVGELLAVRKHAGMIVPRPVQEAMIARARRPGARTACSGSATCAGGRCCVRRWRRPASGSSTPSGSLYLWATRDEDEPGSRWTSWRRWASWSLPGDFYGEAAACYVRVALTATDERVDAPLPASKPD